MTRDAFKLMAALAGLDQVIKLVTDRDADKKLARLQSVFNEALEGAKNAEQSTRT